MIVFLYKFEKSFMYIDSILTYNDRIYINTFLAYNTRLQRTDNSIYTFKNYDNIF